MSNFSTYHCTVEELFISAKISKGFAPRDESGGNCWFAHDSTVSCSESLLLSLWFLDSAWASSLFLTQFLLITVQLNSFFLLFNLYHLLLDNTTMWYRVQNFTTNFSCAGQHHFQLLPRLRLVVVFVVRNSLHKGFSTTPTFKLIFLFSTYVMPSSIIKLSSFLRRVNISNWRRRKSRDLFSDFDSINPCIHDDTSSGMLSTTTVTTPTTTASAASHLCWSELVCPWTRKFCCTRTLFLSN